MDELGDGGVDRKNVDYSLYLVTDSGMLRPGQTLAKVVNEAIAGGVSIVQLREKNCGTREFIETAMELLRVTRKHGVPLLINDRVDIALAIGADGVHVGQDDMECKSARRLLGKDKVIGVSVSGPEEARQAILDGADYLGIGPVYHTDTKKLTKPTLGPAGVRRILEECTDVAGESTPKGGRIKTVAIAGLNSSNVQRLLFQSSCSTRSLDGLALVSAIMASNDPEAAAGDLFSLIKTPPAFQRLKPVYEVSLSEEIKNLCTNIPIKVRETCPMVHHMTNNVVKLFSANATLSIGATPIMSENIHEVEELAAVNGGMVINMGMVAPADVERMLFAVQQSNIRGTPVIFDPVGAGASSVRKAAVKEFLARGYMDVIKGNVAEIRTVMGLEGKTKGVDSIDESTEEEKINLAGELARRERNVVLISGKKDIISNGVQTALVENGHEFLGMITGSGCTLGSVIAAFAAVHREDIFLATVAATVLYGCAAEVAVEEKSVSVGTFLPKFIDALYYLTSREGTYQLSQMAKVMIV